MTHYFDISIPITPTVTVWEGDPPVIVERAVSMDAGASYNVTRLDMGAHTATHVDAPAHFLPGGRGVDALDLDALVGPARVAEFDQTRGITAADLEAAGIPAGTERLLLKTPNSRLWRSHPGAFYRDFVGVTAGGARWLVQRGVRLVGIDYLSIEGTDDIYSGAPVHHVLLEAGVIILETLNLSAVEPGEYTLLCLPLNIPGADGAPARAVLAKDT